MRAMGETFLTGTVYLFNLAMLNNEKLSDALTQANKFACYLPAGDEGIEPPPAVLETAVLPLN